MFKKNAKYLPRFDDHTMNNLTKTYLKKDVDLYKFTYMLTSAKITVF